MSRDSNLPGLSPLWLIGLALVLGTLIAVFVPITVAKGEPIAIGSWLGFIGSVLGGCLTIIGFFLASANIRRQLRVNLISREEERIERQLPGLIQIRDSLFYIEKAETANAVIYSLGRFQEQGQIDVLKDSHHKTRWQIRPEGVRREVPAADEIERRTFMIELQILKDAVGEGEDGSPRINDEKRFKAARKRIHDYFESVDMKIRKSEMRKDIFRAELERYFGS
jgi:hypothetical protein